MNRTHVPFVPASIPGGGSMAYKPELVVRFVPRVLQQDAVYHIYEGEIRKAYADVGRLLQEAPRTLRTTAPPSQSEAKAKLHEFRVNWRVRF